MLLEIRNTQSKAIFDGCFFLKAGNPICCVVSDYLLVCADSVPLNEVKLTPSHYRLKVFTSIINIGIKADPRDLELNNVLKLLVTHKRNHSRQP